MRIQGWHWFVEDIVEMVVDLKWVVLFYGIVIAFLIWAIVSTIAHQRACEAQGGTLIRATNKVVCAEIQEVKGGER